MVPCVHSLEVSGFSCTYTGDPTSSSGTRWVAAVGTPQRVERDSKRDAGLDPTLFGMFRQCNNENQKSDSLSAAFFISCLAILTAASALPLDCWWCGADVTSSKSQLLANCTIFRLAKLVPLSVTTRWGTPNLAKFCLQALITDSGLRSFSRFTSKKSE
ncbi:uncharacterized protein LOC119767235 [Culex quinquefasciatus]|uniref:uncharacterized protein LOC119767235 n=1 Tax=Culex quinquefasciatus TaxID=7176 RepID=UPI0018E37FF8|nr:uncharacterized protein LOC119767235 [Culex quinquefasciatus]